MRARSEKSLNYQATNRGQSINVGAVGLADEEAGGASLSPGAAYGHRLEVLVGKSSMDEHGVGIYPVASDEFFNGDDLKFGATSQGSRLRKVFFKCMKLYEVRGQRERIVAVIAW